MSGFVDATDAGVVEQVLRQALPVVGVDGLLAQLAGVPGLQVERGRRGRLLRAAVAPQASYGDRTLRFDPAGPVVVHVVGGIVLATEPVAPAALPGQLAALVVRAVGGTTAPDDASVVLTALRDAAEIA